MPSVYPYLPFNSFRLHPHYVVMPSGYISLHSPSTIAAEWIFLWAHTKFGKLKFRVVKLNSTLKFEMYKIVMNELEYNNRSKSESMHIFHCTIPVVSNWKFVYKLKYFFSFSWLLVLIFFERKSKVVGFSFLFSYLIHMNISSGINGVHMSALTLTLKLSIYTEGIWIWTLKSVNWILNLYSSFKCDMHWRYGKIDLTM